MKYEVMSKMGRRLGGYEKEVITILRQGGETMRTR